MEYHTEKPLLAVESIRKYFQAKGEFLKSGTEIKAVDGVSFDVQSKSVFALVGESGCGKSTVARLILKLLPLTGGRIFYKGTDISAIRGDDLKRFRRSIQIVFQDPFASLNPRMRIIDTLAEPYKIHKIVPRNMIGEKVVHLLEKVGMGADALNKYPHEFSGGQRQRICIARALTVSPELVVADEPLSALDVSIQAQILNLLQEVRKETGISLIFISHDLNVVRYLSDEVAVMYFGKIVERGNTEELFQSPQHPYTVLLLSSIPKIRDRSQSEIKRHDPSGSDPAGPATVPPGCPFHPRCPKRFDRCDKEAPNLRQKGDRSVACHLY